MIAGSTLVLQISQKRVYQWIGLGENRPESPIEKWEILWFPVNFPLDQSNECTPSEPRSAACGRCPPSVPPGSSRRVAEGCGSRTWEAPWGWWLLHPQRVLDVTKTGWVASEN